MKEIIVDFLNFLTIEIVVIIVAAMPVIELRGAIPIGVSLGLSPLHSSVLGYFGSLIPVPLILLGMRPIFTILRKNRFFRVIIDKILYKSRVKHRSKIKKYGILGLIMLVAIPLPGTGVWSGSLAAALMNIRFKLALPAIMAGNLVAAIIITIFSYGFFNMI